MLAEPCQCWHVMLLNCASYTVSSDLWCLFTPKRVFVPFFPGELRWSYHAGGELNSGLALAADGVVVLPTAGKVLAVTATGRGVKPPSTGLLVWQHDSTLENEVFGARREFPVSYTL